MELKSTDLGSIGCVLQHVYLPAALARTPLTSLLILEENEGDSIVQSHDAEGENQLIPCILENPLANVHGQALRCDDGMLLAKLDVTLLDVVSKGFDQGRRMGCDEERNRTRHFFHDVLSAKILVASFLAHEIYQNLATSGAEETKDMARLTKLLQEAIDAIVQGAEEY
jgi:hypothetical protein